MGNLIKELIEYINRDNMENKEEKPFPKWMWVSDVNEEDAKSTPPVYVVGKFKHPETNEERYISSCMKGIGQEDWYTTSWKYAYDIEEPTKHDLIKKEIAELKAKIAELEGRVK